MAWQTCANQGKMLRIRREAHHNVGEQGVYRNSVMFSVAAPRYRRGACSGIRQTAGRRQKRFACLTKCGESGDGRRFNVHPALCSSVGRYGGRYAAGHGGSVIRMVWFVKMLQVPRRAGSRHMATEYRWSMSGDKRESRMLCVVAGRTTNEI